MSGHETVTGVKRELRGNNGRTLSQTRGKREERYVGRALIENYPIWSGSVQGAVATWSVISMHIS